MDHSTRFKLRRLVTRLGTRDAAALLRIHPALAARVAEDGDAQPDPGTLVRLEVLR